MTGVRSNKGENNLDGHNYQLYTLLHCINCLRNIDCVYDIGRAKVGFGALDDVVFSVTLDGGRKITTAIQVKHSNANKIIGEQYLCQDMKTYLYKYCQSFLEIKTDTPLEEIDQLILWTNIPITDSIDKTDNIRDWFEEFVPASAGNDILDKGNIKKLPYKRYRIKTYHRQKIVQKCKERVRKDNISRMKTPVISNEPSEEEWKEFFERFVFYVNVPKIDELKAHLVKTLGNDVDTLCKQVESFKPGQIIHSSQINRLFTLVNFRNSMKTGPYSELGFKDLNELQKVVQKMFDSTEYNLSRVRASQDIDFTVERLIRVVKTCLKADRERYLVFNYDTFNEKWDELQLLVCDNILIQIGLQCIIVSHTTEGQIHEIENKLSMAMKMGQNRDGIGSESEDFPKYSFCFAPTNTFETAENSDNNLIPTSTQLRSELSALNVIFVGSDLNTNFDDEFDINFLEDSSMLMIKDRKIRLSKSQCATVNQIFCENLFQKENNSMVLELFKATHHSNLQIKASEPLSDSNYRSRIAKCSDSAEIIDLLNQTDFPKLVIHDLPGMGKTTEMIKLCSNFRQKYPDHLVVYLHCTAAVSVWNGSVEHLICSTVTSGNELTNLVIKKVVQLGKLILIMDGYDEVSKTYNKTLKTLISEISRAKMLKLYIATRPQCKDEINSIIKHCGFCKLEPFSEDDQLAYLKDFWEIENAEDESTVVSNTRSIIKQFRTMVNVYGSSLIGIPLQTHMIAVIYKDRIFSHDLKSSESHKLGYKYKEFVELKLLESIKRNYDPANATHVETIKLLNENFLHDHIVAAFKIYENKPQSELEQHCEKIEHYGIVVTRPTVTFIHYTYLEYFFALYLLTYSTEHNMAWYILDSDSLICRFMDYLLDHINPAVDLKPSLHELANTYETPSDYKHPRTSRLHPDKMIEFSRALYKTSAKEIKDILLTLIRNRMFNMFEVVYDSLQIEIKSQVRLCFDLSCDGHPNNIYICSKYLKSSNTLIAILKILWKKKPYIFVILYLTPLSQQEQILELMCDPDFFSLFEWFKELVPQLTKKQQAVVQLFVEIWVERCLLKIIHSNNVKLLKAVIDWTKDMWVAETIKIFLTRKNLLCLFTKNIEFKLVESVEPIRIHMVQSVFDLYSYAFDGQIPMSDDFFYMVQTIKADSIMNAFLTTFLSKSW